MWLNILYLAISLQVEVHTFFSFLLTKNRNKDRVQNISVAIIKIKFQTYI